MIEYSKYLDIRVSQTAYDNIINKAFYSKIIY